MRILPLVFVLLILVHPRVHPTSINISPSKSFYLRGDVITISGKLQAGAVPVSDETVYLLINGSVKDETQTDSEGNFEFNFQIPLDRPPGTYMNITVYFPGSYLFYPTYANTTILVYGGIYVEASFSPSGNSLEEHFSGPRTIEYRISAEFDNGSSAAIDRYISYSYEGHSGSHSGNQTLNDTSGDVLSIDLNEPSYGKITIYAYCDEEGFLFKNNLKLKYKEDLPFVLYEYANVTGHIEATYADEPAYMYVTIKDELGYTDVLASALDNGNVYVSYGGSNVNPHTKNVNVVSDHVEGVFEFELPPGRGGELAPHITLSLPEYIRVSSVDVKGRYVELRNVTVVLPSEYPNGVPIIFTPYLYNELTGDYKLLKPFLQSVEILYGSVYDARRKNNDFILYAAGDLGFLVRAFANDTQTCFNVSQEVYMHGIDVSITTNASGTIRIRPDENFTVYVDISPRTFRDIHAIASIKISDGTGTRTEYKRFDGTLILTFYGNQILNNTMISISVGDRNTTLIVYIQKIGGSTPSPPSPPTNQATGYSRITVLAIILLAILVILVVYLLYLIIKMIKGRMGKKRARPISSYEAVIQNLRRIYRTGNFKLLATEAYKFLTTVLAPRLGVAIKPNDTPRRVAEKIIAAGASASAVMTIVNAYEIAKYSPWDIDDDTAQKIITAVNILIKEHLAKPAPAAR